LPPSVSAAALDEVERALAGLETLCCVLEQALIKRDWQAIAQAQADSRRLQHALRNAMEAGVHSRTPEFDATVTARVGRVVAIRADQVARLERYREAVRERLGALVKFKAYAKSVGAKPRDSRLANLNQLR
jgi:hypothetical protein